VAARPKGIADACDHHHPSTSSDEKEALVKSDAQKRVLHELLPSFSLHHGIVCDALEEEEEEEEDRGNGSSKDMEERRKSLVSVARASNALKMKWGDWMMKMWNRYNFLEMHMTSLIICQLILQNKM